MTMKRVLLSIAIGFVFVVAYGGVIFSLHSANIISHNLHDDLRIPTSAPDKIVGLFYARSDIRHFELVHPIAVGLFATLVNGVIYSLPIYLVWYLINRSKRKPVTPSAEPPPPPEF
jgi:hypothetical protein